MTYMNKFIKGRENIYVVTNKNNFWRLSYFLYLKIA